MIKASQNYKMLLLSKLSCLSLGEDLILIEIKPLEKLSQNMNRKID
jgi:hypothetical protein